MRTRGLRQHYYKYLTKRVGLSQHYYKYLTKRVGLSLHCYKYLTTRVGLSQYYYKYLTKRVGLSQHYYTYLTKHVGLVQRKSGWLYEDYLTTHTRLSPMRHGFAPGFVNYKKGALASQSQVIKITSYLPMIGVSLRVLQLLPPLKLVAMIQMKYC